jgi:probable phosphomutase (TIGR03848 family)
MPLLLLIRHGENEYVKTGKMAGQLPGVHLNGRGKQQAQELADGLADVPLKAIYASSLDRAVETAEPIAKDHKLEIQTRPELMDNAIGKWQGRSWRVLSRTKAWRLVQRAPSRFRFPEGESFAETQIRLVTCLEEIVARHKPRDILAIVFHADPIKLVLAYYLGMPLDNFQRLACDTGSVTSLMVGPESTFLIRLNQKPPLDFKFHKKKGKK